MPNKENSEMSNILLSSDGEQDHLPENTKRESSVPTGSISLDSNSDDDEEKQRLIAQVLERQNTLDDLSSRVDSVKVENLKLKSENQVLGQYIENLMTASSVFQSASPKAKKK
uniref:Short coiled-coil protein A n=1 Tax=Arion vulgaris TaxID=1028688 RepID=A0A0B6YB95_9EUPU